MKTFTNDRFSKSRGFTALELLVVIAVLVAFCCVAAYPLIMKQMKLSDVTWTNNYAKQISLGMVAFEADFGCYPDATTVQAVKDVALKQGQTVSYLGGTNSNDYFRQLFLTGNPSSEEVFYAKTAFTKKPDNATQGNQALAAGEVGFCYFLNAGNKAFTVENSKFHTDRPVVAAPQMSSFARGEFDPEIYNRKAVILRADGSVIMPMISSDRKILIGNNKTLLETGKDTVWGEGVEPVVANPLSK